MVHQAAPVKRTESLLERADNCLNNRGFMTPTCLQSLYNIPSAPATSKDNGIAVTGYELEWPTYADLSVRAYGSQMIECS